MFFLLFGKLPFGSDKKHNAIAHLQSNVNFPNDPTVSNEAINLLQQMLFTDPMSRPTIDEVLEHEWFKKVGMISKSTEQSLCWQVVKQDFDDPKDTHVDA